VEWTLATSKEELSYFSGRARPLRNVLCSSTWLYKLFLIRLKKLFSFCSCGSGVLLIATNAKCFIRSCHHWLKN